MPYKDRGAYFDRFFWADSDNSETVFGCQWRGAGRYIATINGRNLYKIRMYETLLKDSQEFKECVDFLLTDADQISSYINADGTLNTDNLLPSTKVICEADIASGLSVMDVIFLRAAIMHPQCAGATVEEIDGYDPEGVPMLDEDGTVIGYEPNIKDVVMI